MALQSAVEYGGPIVLGLLTGSSVRKRVVQNAPAGLVTTGVFGWRWTRGVGSEQS
jgi:hypothetical protein